MIVADHARRLITADHQQRGDVHAGRGHQMAGRRLVAGRQTDHAVEHGRVHLRLDIVGHEIARRENVRAGTARTGDEIGGRGGTHLEGYAAGGANRLLDHFGDTVQVFKTPDCL